MAVRNSPSGKQSNANSVAVTSPNETQIRIAINEAIQQAVKEDLLVDTGEMRWSERTKTFQTLWQRTALNWLH